MKKVAFYILVALAVCALIYGAYWLAKNGSYWFWYEDMVKETIRELVKSEALKGA